jgi:hypothetical protein
MAQSNGSLNVLLHYCLTCPAKNNHSSMLQKFSKLFLDVALHSVVTIRLLNNKDRASRQTTRKETTKLTRENSTGRKQMETCRV